MLGGADWRPRLGAGAGSWLGRRRRLSGLSGRRLRGLCRRRRRSDRECQGETKQSEGCAAHPSMRLRESRLRQAERERSQTAELSIRGPVLRPAGPDARPVPRVLRRFQPSRFLSCDAISFRRQWPCSSYPRYRAAAQAWRTPAGCSAATLWLNRTQTFTAALLDVRSSARSSASALLASVVYCPKYEARTSHLWISFPRRTAPRCGCIQGHAEACAHRFRSYGYARRDCPRSADERRSGAQRRSRYGNPGFGNRSRRCTRTSIRRSRQEKSSRRSIRRLRHGAGRGPRRANSRPWQKRSA